MSVLFLCQNLQFAGNSSGRVVMPSSGHTDPPGLKKWLTIFYITCALLLIADFLPVFNHSDDKGSSLATPWGFYGIYGFIACVILVVAAKGLRKLVMRAENYYDER